MDTNTWQNPVGYPQEIRLDFSAFPFSTVYESVLPLKNIPWAIWCSKKVLAFEEADPDFYNVEFHCAGAQVDYIRDHNWLNCWVNYAPFQIKWAGKMPKIEFDWWSRQIREVEKHQDWELGHRKLIDSSILKVPSKYSQPQLIARRNLYISQGLSARDLPFINTSLPLTKSVLVRGNKEIVGCLLDLRSIRTKLSSKVKVALTMDQVATGLYYMIEGRVGKCSVMRTKILPKFRRWEYNVKCTESWSNPSGWRVTVKAVPRDDRFSDIKKMEMYASCACPFFMYGGPEYWALSKDYLDGKPRGLATTPDFIKFPWKRKAFVCKHIRAVFKLLKTIPPLPLQKQLERKYPLKKGPVPQEKEVKPLKPGLQPGFRPKKEPEEPVAPVKTEAPEKTKVPEQKLKSKEKGGPEERTKM